MKVKAHSQYLNESTQFKGSICRACPTRKKFITYLSYMSKKVSHKLDLEIKDQFGLNYHILEKG